MEILHKLVPVAALVALFGCQNGSKPSDSSLSEPIAPPIASISPNYQTFEIDPAEPKVLRLKNGSSIIIPANSFEDQQGNPITGKVTLQYKEFHNAADILLSGIPMTVTDETGQKQQLESGGMFDLKATANGQDLMIAKGKTLGVNLASDVKGDFDFFYLEEKKPELSQTTGSIIPQAMANKELAKQYRWKKIYSPTDSAKKVEAEWKRNQNATYFKVNFDTKKYPETSALDTVKWEYAGKYPEENPANAVKENWNTVQFLKPKYKNRMLKEYKNTDKSSIEFVLLDDSSGYIKVDENRKGATLYGWDGKAKVTYSNIPVAGDHSLSIVSSAKCNYICFYIRYREASPQLKVYTKNGKLIYSDTDLGTRDSEVYMLGDNEDRILYCNKAGDHYKLVNLKTASVIAQLPFNGYTSWNHNNSFYKKALILLRNENELAIYNSDGKKLANTVLTGAMANYSDVNTTENPDYVFLSGSWSAEIPLIVWDWKKGRYYESKNLLEYKKSNFEDNQFYDRVAFHPTKPIAIAYDGDFPVIWNFEKGTKVRLDRYKDRDCYFSTKGNYVELLTSYTNSDRKITITNLQGKEIASAAGKESYILIDHDEQQMLVKDGKKVMLKDLDGSMIRDFTAYDSLINYAGFVWENNIVTYVKGEGSYSIMIWDRQGKLIKTSHLSTLHGNLFVDRNTQVLHNFEEGKYHCLYSFQGELEYVIGSSMWTEGYWISDYSSLGALTMPNRNTLRHWMKTEEKLGPHDWLMILKKDNKDFFTYVRLSPSQQKLIETYNKAVDQRIQKETKRVEEEDKLVRSFEINQFGIYNWDRFYKDSTSLRLVASFDFDSVGIDFSNISVFLITGENGTAVIKYPKYSWDKFAFNPAESNTLLAILPDQKIGLLKPEDFKALDLAKIKQEGSYTFKMKLLEGKASEEMIRQILNNKPS